MTVQTSMQPTRRQLSLLVPEAQRAVIEPIRRRLDPIQHALIPAHVTLCRDNELPDLRILAQRLENLTAFSFTMTFSAPAELPDGCVLMRPTSGLEEYQELRRAILGPEAARHDAHLTLLHPRNATGAIPNLTAIGREVSGLSVTFKTIALIVQRGCDPWDIKRQYPSSG